MPAARSTTETPEPPAAKQAPVARQGQPSVTPAAGPLLKMQREVGNQATCDMLRTAKAVPEGQAGEPRPSTGSDPGAARRLRRPIAEAVPRRNGTAGIQATAFPIGRDIGRDILARAAGPGASPSVPTGSEALPRMPAIPSAPIAVQRNGEKDKIVTGATSSVSELTAVHKDKITAHAKAPSGGIPTTLEAVAAMEAADIGRLPAGKGKGATGGSDAKPILQKAFGSNWFYAKDVLIYNNWPESIATSDLPLAQKDNGDLRDDLMWRLIGLRTWEYNDIFTQLRARYIKEDPGLKDKKLTDVLDWGSAGSDTATSDVDLNLKGICNMKAVADFNADFTKRGWPYEAGTVYDVNAYCKDNMWDFNIDEVDDSSAVMSMTSEPNAPKGLVQDKKDSGQQEVAAMIKLIRFLSHGHDLPETIPPEHPWAKYKARLTEGTMVATLMAAEIGYRLWFKQLTEEKAKIVVSGESSVDAALRGLKDGEKLAEGATDMRASNRLYEQKIEQLIAARQELAAAKKENVAPEELLGIAHRVRQLVLEAAMFANEAMITAGASQFVVFGTQLGLKKATALNKDVRVTLTEAQFFHAFTEQLADTIKEFGHFDNLDDGLLKGGKYLMRMTLAADQLDGVKGNQANIANMAKLRKLGDYAMTAKNMSGTVENKRLVMAHALDESGLAGAKTAAKETRKEALLDVIAQFGADVTNAYQAAKSDVTVPAKKKSGPDRKRKENSEARRAAYAKKIGAEMRLADIKGADLTAAIERLGLNVTAVPAPTTASGPVLASTAAK